MPKRLTTVQDHVDDIFKARSDLANVKFSALPVGAERPSDIFSEITALLKENLSQKGFSFNKSKRTFRRKCNEFEHLISIQADSNNYAGVRAACWIHMAVVSKSLKEWRSAHNLYADEYIFSRTLSEPNSGQLVWDFIDPTIRQSEYQDMLQTIHAVALPAFDDWRSLDSARQTIADSKLINRLDSHVEIALWLGDRQTAFDLLRVTTTQQSVREGLQELDVKFGLSHVV